MAKKSFKASSKKSEAQGMEYSPCMYVDFDDLAEVKGVSVGDKVCVVVKGTVKSVEQRADEGSEKAKSSISLADFEAEIVPRSELEDLFADEDD